MNEHGSRPTLGKNNHFSFRASASFARPIKCRTKNFSYTFYTNNFSATERTSSGRRGNFLENSFRVSIIQRKISNGACSEGICGQRENSNFNVGVRRRRIAGSPNVDEVYGFSSFAGRAVFTRIRNNQGLVGDRNEGVAKPQPLSRALHRPTWTRFA